MAEQYSFFDAVLEDDGVTYDREYNAQQFTDYFETLVTTGVIKGVDKSLEVSSSNANMLTSVDTGVAYIDGRYYKNDSPLELTHDTETIGRNRIDRIVIRMDLSPETRYVKAFIKKGVPSVNPIAPTLTQTSNLYEISLAQVKLVGGQTFIASDAIIDERGSAKICPWAGSNILPSFDDNALANHVNNHEIHVTAEEKKLIANAFQKTGGEIEGKTIISKNIMGDSTYTNSQLELQSNNGSDVVLGFHRAGHTAMALKHRDGIAGLEIVNNVNTPGNLYVADVIADGVSLKQSVSNGKATVANAITQKGVATSPTAEFATMAENISKINTGKKFANGSSSSINTSGQARVIVTGLDFNPSIVLVSKLNNANDNYKAIYADQFAFNNSAARINLATQLSSGSVGVLQPTLVSNYQGFEVTVASQYNSNSEGLYSWIAFE